VKRRLLRGSQRGQQDLTLRRIPKLTHQWAAADIYDCLGTTVTSYTGSKRTWKTTQINEKLKKTIDVKKSSNENFKNVIKRKKTWQKLKKTFVSVIKKLYFFLV